MQSQNQFTRPINFKKIKARKITRLIWGESFVLGSNDEKIDNYLKTLIKKARLQFLFETNEKMLSGAYDGNDNNWGSTVMAIDKTKTGEIMLSLADSRLINKVGQVFMTETNAVIWKKVVLDDKMAWMRQEFDTEKVVTGFYDRKDSNEAVPDDNVVGVSEKITVQGYNATIPKHLQVQEVWYHNLGICPLVQFFNLPDMSFINFYKGVNADDQPQGQLLSNTSNNLIVHFNKALLRNQTRIIGYFPPEYINKIKEKMTKDEEWASEDLFINNTLRNDNGDIALEVVAPDLQLIEYMQSIRKNIQLDFEMDGLNFDGSDEKSNLTATGSLLGKELDITTTKAKSSWRQTEISRLIRKVLIVKKLIKNTDDNWESKFSFSINTNILTNTLVQAQTEQLLLQNLITSKKKSIGRVHRVPEDQAKILYQEILAEQKENMKLAEEIKVSVANTEVKKIVQEQGNSIGPNNTPEKRQATPSDTLKSGGRTK